MESSLIDRDAHWSEFQLDPRLMKAISQDMRWEKPTLVQSQAVKLALNGNNIFICVELIGIFCRDADLIQIGFGCHFINSFIHKSICSN
jgi:hypothetical protein